MHVHPARWLAVVAVGAAIAAPSAVLANTALAPTEQDLGGVKKVTVVHDRFGAIINSPTWTDAPGGHATIATKRDGALLVRYNADAFCAGALYCAARVLVDGQEANPSDVTGAALAGRDQMGSYTIERSTGVLPAGQHAVQVQLRLFIPDDSANLYVKASHLTVEQVAA